ncbi:hypothetical protein ACP70R_026512 [Stipagrostis hirtigluma subsp. patula]
MGLSSIQLPPGTRQPPPKPVASSAGSTRGARPRSGHLAVLVGRPRPRRARAQAAAASDSRPHEAVDCAGRDTKLRADKFFQVEMTVRDCDLDEYGVVNNTVFAAYIDTAREEILAGFGISRCWIARTGRAMAISELNLKYFAPLKPGAKFVVMVRPVLVKGARMVIEHFIETLPERKLVLEATATVVFLDENYRPTRMFPEMCKVLHFFSS